MKYKILHHFPGKNWEDHDHPVFYCKEDAERFIQFADDWKKYGVEFKIDEITDVDGASHDVLITKLD